LTPINTHDRLIVVEDDMAEPKGVQKSLRIPDDIDNFIQSMVESYPELTYASAVRELIRAGRRSIQDDGWTTSSSTPIGMASARQRTEP
jgi:Arc/MetJ-type ribon-helix-helix transcriptional regulator